MPKEELPRAAPGRQYFLDWKRVWFMSYGGGGLVFRTCGARVNIRAPPGFSLPHVSQILCAIRTWAGNKSMSSTGGASVGQTSSACKQPAMSLRGAAKAAGRQNKPLPHNAVSKSARQQVFELASQRGSELASKRAPKDSSAEAHERKHASAWASKRATAGKLTQASPQAHKHPRTPTRQHASTEA